MLRRVIYILIPVVLIISIPFLWNNNTEQANKPAPATSIPQAAINPQPAEIKEAKVKVTFVELGSLKCVPCKMMQPIMDEIAQEYRGQVKVVFYDVWSPAGRPYAEKYKVRSIPTQVFLDKDGKEYYRHVGFFPKEEIIKVLQLKGVE